MVIKHTTHYIPCAYLKSLIGVSIYVSKVVSVITQYVDLLESVRTIHSKDKTNQKLVSLRPSILRSLFTVGLFCKHFDMDVISQKTSPKVTMTTLCLCMCCLF